MALVRLGKMVLRWCPHCNVPILEQKECGSCGAATVPVEVTPPGDIRPAFAHDIDLVRRTIDAQFGDGAGKAVLPDGRVALMNKAPALDRMDEIIVDGAVVGSLRYDLDRGWVFLPRMPAARAMEAVATRGRVIGDDGAIKPVLSGSNLLAPGVVSTDPGIKVGDEVIVLDQSGKAFAAGMARMSSEEIAPDSRGMAVKVRWNEAPRERAAPNGSTWQQAIEANRPEMERKVGEAVSFMKRVVKENDRPAMISFSGGKDSLAVLLLSLKAGMKLPVFFIDTGLEFPETVEHVKRAAERHGLELIIEEAPRQAFEEGLRVFGPPGRDYRWCCKTNKLGPTVRAIMKHYPKGVLSFIGQRRYESESRASKPRVWSNPWTPGQIGASPIQNWTALHVWLLIMGEGEEHNPWYDRGLDRIGCYLCPASDLGEMRQVEASSQRFKEWTSFLEGYAASRGYPKEWIEYGAWRWRSLPPSIKQELDRIHVSVKANGPGEGEKPPENLRLYIQKGASPCTMGYSIEGAFNRPLDLERVANVLNMLGEVTLNVEEGWCAVDGITVYDQGALIGKSKEEEELGKKMERVRRTVVKAEECVGCGVCIARCCEGALRLERGRVLVETARCAHCGRCLEPCPAITFGDSAFEF